MAVSTSQNRNFYQDYLEKYEIWFIKTSDPESAVLEPLSFLRIWHVTSNHISLRIWQIVRWKSPSLDNQDIVVWLDGGKIESFLEYSKDGCPVVCIQVRPQLVKTWKVVPYSVE